MKLMPLQPGSGGKKYVGGMGEIATRRDEKMRGNKWLGVVGMRDDPRWRDERRVCVTL